MLDHVEATGWHEHGGDARRCWAVARSGVPVREQLFNGSICRPGRNNGGATLPIYMRTPAMAAAEHVEVAPPAMLPRYVLPGPAGPRPRRRPPPADAVFLNSRGEVGSLAPSSFFVFLPRWPLCDSLLAFLVHLASPSTR